jgi:hypothetical protein
MQKYNLQKKILWKETKILQDIYITLYLTNLLSFNTNQNIMFQKFSYK